MSKSAKENATHITNIKGVLEERTDNPTDRGVEGLQTGRTFYRTDTNRVVVSTNTTTFRYMNFTTTSTTTS